MAPIESAGALVGSPVAVSPEYHDEYKRTKREYKRAKADRTATADMRNRYKTMRENLYKLTGQNIRAATERRGRGLTAKGLSDMRVKGGMMASPDRFRRM